MSDETDTTILRRAKEGAGKHAGSALGGLSAAAIVFIYATFTPKADFQRHADEETRQRSQNWQKIMDHEVQLDRLKRRFSALDETNTTVVVSQP